MPDKFAVAKGRPNIVVNGFFLTLHMSHQRLVSLVLGFVLLGYLAFLAPQQMSSENIDTKPGRRITLLNRMGRSNYKDYEKATVSFRYPLSVRNDKDLRYGGLNYFGDRDWFFVAFGPRDQSRIQDLGNMDWSDNMVVPVLPILPCPPDESCHRLNIPQASSVQNILDLNPHIAKPIVGHMYVVHTHDMEANRSDFYTLFRVEELRPNESCTITWKRIPTPKR